MKLKDIWVVLTLVLFGCTIAPEPKVWMEKGATLKHYRGFEVMPAQNETGKTFDVDVAAILTEQLVSKLRAKSYTVNAEGQEPQDVLTLRSSVVKYESGSGSAECIVRTVLIDRKTGKLLGEMVTGHSVDAAAAFAGGLLIGPIWGPLNLAGSMAQSQKILDTIATGIVDELEKRIQEGHAKPS